VALRSARADHLRLVAASKQADAASPRAERSDEELIEGVLSGNGAIAAELYDRLFVAVDRTLVRLFGRREPDHEDLVQASFEQILRTIVERRYARACKLTTWASTIASHVGMNALRARKSERRYHDRTAELHVGAPEGRSRDASYEARDRIARVRAHLAAMDPAKAEAVLLHDVLGHELAEIAVMTGASVAAAQSRLVRGRKELFVRLAREEAEVPNDEVRS
jgi:RNA polymerase sigma-70 factor (ECF subfamily)